MTVNPRTLQAGALVIALAVLSCDTPTTPAQFDHAAAHPNYATVSAGELTGLAKELRQATANFNATIQATKAGYEVASPCVAVPGLGGMGFHWVNGSLVDPVFDPLKPEAVLYEPTKNG